MRKKEPGDTGSEGKELSVSSGVAIRTHQLGSLGCGLAQRYPVKFTDFVEGPRQELVATAAIGVHVALVVVRKRAQENSRGTASPMGQVEIESNKESGLVPSKKKRERECSRSLFGPDYAAR
jgi:hypothetical protein